MNGTEKLFSAAIQSKMFMDSWMKLGFCGVVLIVVTPVNKNIMWLDILNPSTLTLQASTVFSVKSFVQIVILSKPIFLEITVANIL